MQNNGFHFVRLINDGERLHCNTDRKYPLEVYPFGSAEIELFAYEDDYWRASEKKTGLLVARGLDMDEAVSEAKRVIDEFGKEDFVNLIRLVLDNLNLGMEYDYAIKSWVDPKKRVIEPEIPEGADE
jgi:hypothetical protein